MLKILINAYACSPTWGSEPGMGWNWIKALAKDCDLYVITEGEWKEDIEAAVNLLPYKNNLHFFYNPVSTEIRQMCWNQGDWRFYYYYRQWQKKTLRIAQQICSEHQIDIIHQLNMVGFREPGLLWKIKGPRYIWGPIGGMDNIPLAYLRNAGLKQNVFCRLKNFINSLQYKYQPNVRKAIQRADALVPAVKGVQFVLENYYHKRTALINETGCTIDSTCPLRIKKEENSTFNILWVGKFDFRKQLGLALQSLVPIKDLDIKLHICGAGNEEQTLSYKSLAKSKGVDHMCVWHGVVNHDKIQHIMAHSDLFFFTSIMEATSTVILEAISSGLPILCFNTCGFGPIVTSEIGRKIELSTPGQSIFEFASQIKELYHHRELLNEMSSHEIEYRKTLSWGYKAKKMMKIYHSVLEGK